MISYRMYTFVKVAIFPLHESSRHASETSWGFNETLYLSCRKIKSHCCWTFVSVISIVHGKRYINRWKRELLCLTLRIWRLRTFRTCALLRVLRLSGTIMVTALINKNWSIGNLNGLKVKGSLLSSFTFSNLSKSACGAATYSHALTT